MKNPPQIRFTTRRDFLGRLSLGPAALALAPRLRAAGRLGPALQTTEHCRLAGVVTGTRAKGEQWARDYGFSEKNIFGYDTMARLADCPDIVYVVTPNGRHARDVIAAARAGKHVICEKPLGTTVAECDAMRAACRAVRVKFSVGYRLHFDPYHRELMRLATDPAFGPFTTMTGDRGFALRPGAWRADKQLTSRHDLAIIAAIYASAAQGGKRLAVKV